MTTRLQHLLTTLCFYVLLVRTYQQNSTSFSAPLITGNTRCNTIPISVSNVTNCIGNVCNVEFLTEFMVSLGSTQDSCFQLTYPDGTVKNIKFNIQMTSKVYPMKFLYATSNAEIHQQHAYCGCPDLINYELNPLPWLRERCDGGYNVYCLIRNYYQALQPGSNSGCIFSSGDTRNSFVADLHMKDNILVYSLDAPRRILTGQVTNANGTKVTWEWDSSATSSIFADTDLSFMAISNQNNVDLHTGHVLLIDRNDPVNAYATSKDYINLSGYDPSKIGWFRWVNGVLKFDSNSIENAFVVHRFQCISNGFQWAFNRLDPEDLMIPQNELQTHMQSPYSVYLPYDPYITFMSSNRKIFSGVQAPIPGIYNQFSPIYDWNILSSPLVSTIASPNTGCLFSTISNNIVSTTSTINFKLCQHWNGQNYTNLLTGSYLRLKPVTGLDGKAACALDVFILTIVYHQGLTREFGPADGVNGEPFYVFNGVGCTAMHFIDSTLQIASTTSIPGSLDGTLLINDAPFKNLVIRMSGKGSYKFINSVQTLPKSIKCQQANPNSFTVQVFFESSTATEVYAYSNTSLIHSNILQIAAGKSVRNLTIGTREMGVDSINFCTATHECKKCDFIVQLNYSFTTDMKTNIFNGVIDTLSPSSWHNWTWFTTGSLTWDYTINIFIILTIVTIVIGIIAAIYTIIGTVMSPYWTWIKIMFFWLYLPYMIICTITRWIMTLFTNNNAYSSINNLSEMKNSDKDKVQAIIKEMLKNQN